MAEEVEILKHHPHLLTQLVHGITLFQDILPIHHNAAAGRRIQQVESPQEGALSRSGRPDDADNFSGVDFTTHVFEHLKGAAVRVVKGFAEVRNGNHSTFFLGDAKCSSRPISHTSTK